MRLSDGHEEERGMGMPVIYTIVGVSAVILLILAVVFFSNSQRNSGSQNRAYAVASPSPTPEEDLQQAEGEENGDIESLYRSHKLRAEDLDFWNMYQDGSVVVEEPEPTESPSPTASHEPTDEEMEADGRHIQVTLHDGETKWVEINEDLPQNDYDFTNLRIVNGKMEYDIEGEKESFLGVELSEESGQVDFKRLKEDGVDFVMLHLGSRGYETGRLSLDESFVGNITAAQEADLMVGVVFSSQAIDVEEAVEEAEYVITNLIPYHITYPVAFEMKYAANDKSRIDNLTADEKSQIAEAFLSEIEYEGYRTLLYGDRNFLLGEIYGDKLLEDYDVWLSDQSAVPDYPYQFRLWRYAGSQEIGGVEKKAAYSISFVDYSRK